MDFEFDFDALDSIGNSNSGGSNGNKRKNRENKDNDYDYQNDTYDKMMSMSNNNRSNESDSDASSEHNMDALGYDYSSGSVESESEADNDVEEIEVSSSDGIDGIELPDISDDNENESTELTRASDDGQQDQEEQSVGDFDTDFDTSFDEEDLATSAEPISVQKKEFGGHNKDVIFSQKDAGVAENESNISTSLDDIPDIQLGMDENGNASLLDANGGGIPTIKIICIGGSEQYYKSILTAIPEKMDMETGQKPYQDIQFVKYTPTGGKNTLYVIDTVNPDIILMYHNTQLQSAIQFHQSILNGFDDKGVPYRDKYLDKRLIVISPKDISSEMNMRNAGIKFFVRETNPKTHAVDINDLVMTIRAAYNDILAKKERREKRSLGNSILTKKRTTIQKPIVQKENVLGEAIQQVQMQAQIQEQNQAQAQEENGMNMTTEESITIPSTEPTQAEDISDAVDAKNTKKQDSTESDFGDDIPTITLETTSDSEDDENKDSTKAQQNQPMMPPVAPANPTPIYSNAEAKETPSTTVSTEPSPSLTPVPAVAHPQNIVPSQSFVQSNSAPVITEPPETSKIIAVYSATGGSGKTMFATNLASILSKYSNLEDATQLQYRVALIESNFTCSVLDLFYDFKFSNNIGKLAQEVSSYLSDDGQINIPEEKMQPLISQYMYHEPNSHIDIMLGIETPLEIDRIGSGFMYCLLNTLRNMYDVVILDMGSDLSKHPALETFNEADEIYYIMPMDIPSIRNTKTLSSFFTGFFKFSNENVKIILNKVETDNEYFGVEDIYNIMGKENFIPEGTIPYMHKEVADSITRGIPIVMEDINNPVSQAIFSIAAGVNHMLTNVEVETESKSEKEEKKGLFGGLFGGGKKKNKDKEKEEKKSSKSNSSNKSQKSSGSGLFGKKNASQAHSNQATKTNTKPRKPSLPANHVVDEDVEYLDVPMDDILQAEEQKDKKKGFFANLFGGLFSKNKKNKDKKVIKNKKGAKKSGENALPAPKRELGAPKKEDQEKPKKKGFGGFLSFGKSKKASEQEADGRRLQPQSKVREDEQTSKHGRPSRLQSRTQGSSNGTRNPFQSRRRG